jgi:HAD superfamily hydrolase (TIGR01549 family)
MQNIKFIYFDVGYTLINEDKVWKVRCQEQAQTDEAKKLGLGSSDIYNEIIQASISYQPQYRTVVKKFGFKEVAPYRHELENIYDNCDKVLSILSEKYKLGIIANQPEGLLKRLEAFDILKYFQEVISSWEYNLMKPDIELFKMAVNKAKCNASEIVMVGDRLDNDVFPANMVGMRTIWIKQGFGGIQKPISEMYYPTEEVNNLEELLLIL